MYSHIFKEFQMHCSNLHVCENQYVYLGLFWLQTYKWPVLSTLVWRKGLIRLTLCLRKFDVLGYVKGKELNFWYKWQFLGTLFTVCLPWGIQNLDILILLRHLGVPTILTFACLSLKIKSFKGWLFPSTIWFKTSYLRIPFFSGSYPLSR